MNPPIYPCKDLLGLIWGNILVLPNLFPINNEKISKEKVSAIIIIVRLFPLDSWSYNNGKWAIPMPINVVNIQNFKKTNFWNISFLY